MLHASIMWNPYTQKNISVLENIQNRATRWVYGSGFNPHTNTWSKSSCVCWSELQWPSLSTHRKFLSQITMYDMLHHHISLDFCNFLLFPVLKLDLTPSPFYVNTCLPICIGIPFLLIVLIVFLLTYFLPHVVLLLNAYYIDSCALYNNFLLYLLL